MPFFEHGGFSIHYETWQPLSGRPPAKAPVLLVHGFASSIAVNWVGPLWVKALTEAGHFVIAFDHRGHGLSSSSNLSSDYSPQNMASDCFEFLNHLNIENSHFLGYSMGARVSAFAALLQPGRVASLCMAGLGMALIEGSGFWGPVRQALLTDDLTTIIDQRALMFRKFADQTKSDRLALAACVEGSRANMNAAEFSSLSVPTLIAVGSKDDLAGSAEQLAALNPNAEAFDIKDRDHMLAVGDRTFKSAYLAFLAKQGSSPAN